VLKRAALLPEKWVMVAERFLPCIPWLGGMATAEGIEAHARAEGVHIELQQD